MTAPTTRQRILDAALVCFLEDGYEQTTIARIREGSGASNGALFHHFATKEAIADALFVDAIASFQDGLWDVLRRRPRTLRAAVRGVIAHQMGWIEAHTDLARFLYLRGHLDWGTPAGSRVAALNRDLSAAFAAWMAPLVERGDVRRQPMLLVNAIVSGPTHAIAQRWLAGQVDAAPSSFVDALANAATAALSGVPVRRGSRASAPSRGRVALALLDDDGGVLARGEAMTEFLTT
jgi:AcrR family transcriptional regulator